MSYIVVKIVEPSTGLEMDTYKSMIQKKCHKKQFTKKQAIGYLYGLKDGGYGKRPWRDEVSYYKCDNCKSYHVSSKIDVEGYTVITGKTTYFDFQKEKWRTFLQNQGKNNGNITRKKKRK